MLICCLINWYIHYAGLFRHAGNGAIFTGFYARWAPPAFLVCIILLLCVMVFGHIGKGAQRWLDLGSSNSSPLNF